MQSNLSKLLNMKGNNFFFVIKVRAPPCAPSARLLLPGPPPKTVLHQPRAVPWTGHRLALHPLPPAPCVLPQSLEVRGLVIRNQTQISAPAGASGALKTNVVHLPRYAPPVCLGPHATFKVSSSAFWGARAAPRMRTTQAGRSLRHDTGTDCHSFRQLLRAVHPASRALLLQQWQPPHIPVRAGGEGCCPWQRAATRGGRVRDLR
jgi:hypothetical protein